jgi:hypothetical protein
MAETGTHLITLTEARRIHHGGTETLRKNLQNKKESGFGMNGELRVTVDKSQSP